jgi:hypothetical protein
VIDITPFYFDLTLLGKIFYQNYSQFYQVSFRQGKKASFSIAKTKDLKIFNVFNHLANSSKKQQPRLKAALDSLSRHHQQVAHRVIHRFRGKVLIIR